MRGAIPPLPQYAFMAWCSVNAEGQLLSFTFMGFSIATIEMRFSHQNFMGISKCEVSFPFTM
jgi:hypothetical protein